MLNVTNAFTAYCSLVTMALIPCRLCGLVLLGVYCCVAICHHQLPRKLKRTRSKLTPDCFQMKRSASIFHHMGWPLRTAAFDDSLHELMLGISS
ncbi:hypothetical protein BO94DRAFT_255358 [Aspergillus sclerotioniger CBS 115572]|uniref:Uncharacterized protein n=1 Tax=Aspergillus sclerotioniger CBS 115572 TaxID=1450535 RepID=A0A317VFE8_9EURO|nr:hypothetical protein BO94DRAFT_255358 [Aspergillus sclerotioniger CBS 115572]PWY71827.1 hypothetical protein BO94DRAFT_255358 [Aspergillus sclerotioniger CBS 115572]